MAPLDPASIYAAAEVIADADPLLVAAGAGMGVYSGFGRAHPAVGRRGLQLFDDVSIPGSAKAALLAIDSCLA